jgi:hypothetical protein
MILVIALIFLVVLSLMGIAAIMTSTSTSSIFGGMRRADEALYNAEAGIEAARRVIAQENPNFDQVYSDGGKLPGLGNIDGVVVCGNGSYQVRVINDESDDGGPTRENNGVYIIRSTGIVGDAVKTLEVVVESFSRFFYFSQVEEAGGTTGFPPEVLQKAVFFRTGDVMDGPVHSNSALRIAGTPSFLARTTSSSDPLQIDGSVVPLGTQGTIFQGPTNWTITVKLPVGPDRDFGTADDLNEVYQGASARGEVIDTFNQDPNNPNLPTDFRVHFEGESGQQATIYKLTTDPTKTNPEVWVKVKTKTIGADFNGVIYFHGGGTVHVGGRIVDGVLDGSSSAVSNSKVKGKWTIASDLTDLDRKPVEEVPPGRGLNTPGPMHIDGDIKYIGTYPGGTGDDSHYPIVDGSVKAEGLLGLVSANNVWISYQDAIRNNGITIHASIMATCFEQSGSFSAATGYLDSAKMTPGKPLYLMGGTIQYYRGVVGLFNAAGVLTEGFQKKYKYDKRLYYMSPPSFPVAVNLKTKSWKE